MLFPNNSKFEKVKKSRPSKIFQFSYYSSVLVYGKYGLKVIAPGNLSSIHLEVVTVLLSKNLKKIGKWWLRIFPNVPVTSKGLGLRMGGGKGQRKYWVSSVKPGQVILEISDLVPSFIALPLLKVIAVKLPLPSTIVLKK